MPTDTHVLNRFKRAQGQLAGVVRMIEDGRAPDTVLHQLKAVGHALDRAGYALVIDELRRAGGADVADVELQRIEKLFLSLT